MGKLDLLHSGEDMFQSILMKSNLPMEGGCVEKREYLPPASMWPLDINFRASGHRYMGTHWVLSGWYEAGGWLERPTSGNQKHEEWWIHHIFRGQMQHTGAHEQCVSSKKTYYLVKTRRKIMINEAQNNFWKQTLYSNFNVYILQGYVHSYRHTRQLRVGEEIKKENNTEDMCIEDEEGKKLPSQWQGRWHTIVSNNSQ